MKKCLRNQCEVSVPKQHLFTHQDRLCLWRNDKCPLSGFLLRSGGLYSYCRQCSGSYHDTITYHYYKCSNWPTRCPNSCDPYLTLRRSTVDGHVKEECPETVVECTFAEVGCQVKVSRRNMSQHMQEAAKEHMMAVFTDYMELKNDHKKMKRENEKLKEEVHQLKLQMK